MELRIELENKNAQMKKVNALVRSLIVVLVLIICFVVLIRSTSHLRLTWLAEWKANNLVETGYFEHDNKGGGFLGLFENATFRERSGLLGLGLWESGEILYHGPCDYNEAVVAWNNSPTHEVILNDKTWTDMVSITKEVGDNECYIVNEYSK